MQCEPMTDSLVHHFWSDMFCTCELGGKGNCFFKRACCCRKHASKLEHFLHEDNCRQKTFDISLSLLMTWKAMSSLKLPSIVWTSLSLVRCFFLSCDTGRHWLRKSIEEKINVGVKIEASFMSINVRGWQKWFTDIYSCSEFFERNILGRWWVSRLTSSL